MCLTVWSTAFVTNWIGVVLIVRAMTIWFFDCVILTRWTGCSMVYIVICICAMWIHQISIVWTANLLTIFPIPNMEWWTMRNRPNLMTVSSCVIQIPYIK